MAKFYYNDVLLPEIPVVEGYPYQVIFEQTIVSDGSITYALYSTEQPMYGKPNALYENVTTMSQQAEAQYWRHTFIATTNTWIAGSISNAATNVLNIGDTGTGTDRYLFTPIWSNYDIHLDSADSTEIFFSASEPVLYVPEIVDPTYYNGVLLPKIPEDETKPYSYIVYMKAPQTNAEMYVCATTDSPIYIATYLDPILAAYPSENGLTIMCNHNPGEDSGWMNNTEQELITGQVIVPIGTAGGVTYELIWSNVDVPNGSADSTDIYLAASDPVPVGEKQYLVPESKLKALANSIRSKTGKTEDMGIDEMISEIGNISGGGSTVLSSKGVSF